MKGFARLQCVTLKPSSRVGRAQDLKSFFWAATFRSYNCEIKEWLPKLCSVCNKATAKKPEKKNGALKPFFILTESTYREHLHWEQVSYKFVCTRSGNRKLWFTSKKDSKEICYKEVKPYREKPPLFSPRICCRRQQKITHKLLRFSLSCNFAICSKINEDKERLTGLLVAKSIKFLPTSRATDELPFSLYLFFILGGRAWQTAWLLHWHCGLRGVSWLFFSFSSLSRRE